MAVVLVADDEESIRRLVCVIVTLAGHKCFTAANGLEAVALFRSNRDSIDLVITDMTMPVMDGADAVARIRETRTAVPVICMTGYTEKPMPPGVLPLHKPFTAPALLNLIKRALAR